MCMKKSFLYFFLSVLIISPHVGANGILSVNTLEHGEKNAEYTTTHFFIDEVLGTTKNIEVIYDLSDFDNITDVQVFSNINRRDLARIDKDNDGYADGIEPPDGSL